MWVYGLDWVDPGQRQVADACECGNEPSGSVKCGEFLDYLQTSQLLKKDSSPWIKQVLLTANVLYPVAVSDVFQQFVILHTYAQNLSIFMCALRQHISIQTVVKFSDTVVPQETPNIIQSFRPQRSVSKGQAVCTGCAERFSTVALLGKPTRTILSQVHCLSRSHRSLSAVSIRVSFTGRNTQKTRYFSIFCVGHNSYRLLTDLKREAVRGSDFDFL